VERCWFQLFTTRKSTDLRSSDSTSPYAPPIADAGSIRRRRGHSRLGIASFAIGIANLVDVLGYVALLVFGSQGVKLTGMLLFAFMILATLIGGALGLLSLVLSKRRRVFGAIGLAIAGVVALAFGVSIFPFIY
jgi:hypothetical protein